MDKCNCCILKDEVVHFKNELVLCEDRVYKFLGVKDEPEDYYYILKDLHGEILFSSCCGCIIPLQGLLDQKNYEYLESTFELNDFEKRVVEDDSEKFKCYCSKETK